jgi:hypothetical protein
MGILYNTTPAPAPKNKERAICIQQMNECAAAIRMFPQNWRMRFRLRVLTRHAYNMGWLPECFKLDPELKV